MTTNVEAHVDQEKLKKLRVPGPLGEDQSKVVLHSFV